MLILKIKKGWYALKHHSAHVKNTFPYRNFKEKKKKSIGQYPFKCTEPVEPAEYVAL